MYENNAGMQKASHERMLNDRGRKVIKEKIGNTHFNSYDHFRHMTSKDGAQFDADWSNTAKHMNFNSGLGNALEYGGSDPFANNRNQANYANRHTPHHAAAKARGLAMPEYMDDG